jgi:type I restriction enzyme, S subunit
MSSEWREVLLGDIAVCRNGAGVKQSFFRSSGVPLARVSDFTEWSIDLRDCLFVEVKHAERWRGHQLRHADILVATVGSWPPNWSSVVGKTVRVPSEAAGAIQNQNTCCIVARDGASDQRYLFYVLRSWEFADYAANSAGGSANQARLPLAKLERFTFRLPSLPEQRAIARVLGALDDKIELNRKMNETLEQMARAIFKSWFVDFEPFRGKGMVDSELGSIPKGWTIGVLDGFVQTCLGGDWGLDAQAEDDLEPVRCIRGADIPDLQMGGTGKMPVRHLKPSSLQKRRLGKGDIVVEISGGSPTQSTGRSVLISDSLLSRLDNPLVCSNFCRLLKLRTSALSGFVYLWLRSLYANNELLRYETGTTGIKNFALTLFSANHKLSIPPPETLQAFDRNVAPIFDMQQANAKEGDILAAIRDALLPKLMSGQARVGGRSGTTEG